MSPRTSRAAATRLATVIALVAAGLAATAAGATGSAGGDDTPRELARTADSGATQVVMVQAPTVADRNKVIGLGLDVTEHADKHGIEVVLHDAQDAQTLRDDLAFMIEDLWPDPGPLLVDGDRVAVEIRVRMNGNVSDVADVFDLENDRIKRLAIYGVQYNP